MWRGCCRYLGKKGRWFGLGGGREEGRTERLEGYRKIGDRVW